ncbi:lipopolysaccharide heptosyltransferase II [Desulfobacterales bacterium HSG17]|nr:lipopolysaccharide heptosyltransferase II [Desulfobacterales bacterium HSG17]
MLKWFLKLLKILNYNLKLKSNIMNILIIKLSAIGDVIHTLPALNAIRKHYPNSKITWVVEEAAASIVQGHEALDRVLVSKRKKWLKGLLKSSSRNKSIKEISSFIRQLRDTNYDLVIDFHQLLKSGVVVWLARGKVKAGFDKGMQHMEHSYFFLNKPIPPVSMEHHALSRYLMLVQALGIPVKKVEYKLPVGKPHRQAIDKVLSENNMGNSKMLIAINPVAQWKTKLWENKKFSKLADCLIKTYKADIIFTGGPEDLPIVQDIIDNMKENALNLAGKTTLKILAALYEKTRFVISTDTGPMHLCVAVKTPVIALFGPTAPWRTGPFGPNHEVIRLGMECSPCFKRECMRKDLLCMRGIDVEDILERVDKLVR